jgi:AcrR family transcriptional regulator
MRKTRPGGRSAQTRAAVFAAVESILADKDPAAVSMVEIAERAGVAATSLYRRWGDVRALMTEVAVERLIETSPLPDTGSLAGDLNAWTRAVAASLASRQGSLFFRVYVGAAPTSPEEGAGRARALAPRIEQIAEMLNRARARGDAAPSVFEVTDHLLAPLYMRSLFGFPADGQAAEGLVAFLLEAVAARSAKTTQ